MSFCNKPEPILFQFVIALSHLQVEKFYNKKSQDDFNLNNKIQVGIEPTI